MNNTQMVVELKAAVAAAKQEHFNSYSTRKAAESLLECLRRDGVMAGHGSSGYASGSSAPSAHYGMNYVDGGAPAHAGYGAPAAPAMQIAHGGKVMTEGHMPGSSWSPNY